MTPEQIESMLERTRPEAPPPRLRRDLLDRVAGRSSRPAADRWTRWQGRLTMTIAAAFLLGIVGWIVGNPFVGAPSSQGGPVLEDTKLGTVESDWAIEPFTWSADGKHWACVALERIGEGGPNPAGVVRKVIVDGRKDTGAYGDVSNLQFGADGHYAYIAAVQGHAPTAVIDGVPRKEDVPAN